MKNQCKISSAWMMIFLLGLVIPVLFPFVKSRGVLYSMRKRPKIRKADFPSEQTIASLRFRISVNII